MHSDASRRKFLAAALAMPAAGIASSSTPQPAAALAKLPLPLFAPGPAFPMRTLGKTGLKVTPVAFGCMITSDQSVIEKAADIGINYFDTARGYQGGNNERMVGAALRSRRKNLVLSSKSPANTKDGLLADLETSLREIGTDYLDIWYLHAKSSPSQVTDEMLEAQRIAKQQGKIRFSGISTHAGFDELIPDVIARKHFDVLLTSYNFSMEGSIGKLIASARNAGIGIVAMKVMAGGFRRIKPDDPMYPKFQREGAHLAMLKWVLRDKHVDTSIPSMTDLDQLDENLKAMAEPFGTDDSKLLAAHLRYISPLYCRMCGACAGTCAKGLPVSELIRFVSYAEGYGQFSLGRENYLQLAAGQRDALCADCTECTVSCPNGVAVARRVSRAQELFA